MQTKKVHELSDEELMNRLDQIMTNVNFYEPYELTVLDCDDDTRFVVMAEDQYDEDADIINEVITRYHNKWKWSK